MATTRSRLRSVYGAGGLHLLLMLGALALVGYAVAELGPDQLWDPDVWWQSILVWFLGAVLLHDLLLFPLYAVADRLLVGITRPHQPPGRTAKVPIVNYIRVPVLAVGLLFLMFFPGILQHGESSFSRATGQTQEPFLERWLILSAVILGLSAVAYGLQCLRARRSVSEPEQVGDQQESAG